MEFWKNENIYVDLYQNLKHILNFGCFIPSIDKEYLYAEGLMYDSMYLKCMHVKHSRQYTLNYEVLKINQATVFPQVHKQSPVYCPTH